VYGRPSLFGLRSVDAGIRACTEKQFVVQNNAEELHVLNSDIRPSMRMGARMFMGSLAFQIWSSFLLEDKIST